MGLMKDIRDDIFRDIIDKTINAIILADDGGIIAGTNAAFQKSLEIGIDVVHIIEEGRTVNPGDEIARFKGIPKKIAIAEDLLIGCISKSSGIATNAARLRKIAGENIRIVSGAWKKMPVEIKEIVRKAITVGGCDFRISKEPFIYLDKNYVKMLGGIRKSLEAVANLSDYKKVIQIKGNHKDIAAEALEAAEHRADIVFIDSGNYEDLRTVSEQLKKNGFRKRVEIAFGGNVKERDVDLLKTFDLNILAIGKEIIDAPLLDLKMEIVE
jgi:nicotinate-nucleotide pyrophosphorylase (carboxylating)